MTEQDMLARIAELEARVKELEDPIFPKAAPGCGALLYYYNSAGHPMILFSRRGTEHGEGFGITGGGFFDVKKAKKYKWLEKPLTYQEECYRELCEEFRDEGQSEDNKDTFEQVQAKAKLFTGLISFDAFEDNAELIAGFVVHAPDDPFGNKYHACNFFCMEIPESAAKGLMEIPANDERPETVAYRAGSAKVVDIIGMLFHAHEAEPITRLVKKLAP